MADLHPVVIPAIEHTFKSIKYTCSGEGLYKDGHPYDPHAEKLIPPKSTKAGAKPTELERKPVAYWKAQCAFRGLNQTGAINDLQLRLREAKKKMLPELKAAESELNKEFKKKNKLARDGTWKNLKTAEQKAKADPQKYLKEAFPAGATGRPTNLDIVVLKIADDRSKVANAAEVLGLEAISVDAPWTGTKKPSPDHWLIIGRDRDAVWDQMKDVERQSSRSEEKHLSESSISHTAKQIESKATLKPKPKAQTAAKAIASPRFTPYSISKPESNVEDIGRKRQTARKSAFNDRDEELNERYPPPPPGAPPQKMKAWHTSVPMARKSAFPATDNNPPQSSSHSRGPRTKQTARKSTFGDRDEELNEKYPPPSPGSPPQKKKAWHSKKNIYSDEDAKDEKVFSSKPVDNIWDIRGSWSISCPSIADEWPCGPMSLEMNLEQQNGKQQMYGTFDFGIITGIMRFEKPIPVPKGMKSEGGYNKRKRGDYGYDDDDDDVDMMDAYPAYHSPHSDTNEQTSYTESCFYLGTKDKPTARRPTWIYRWRGEETGEGQIQLGSDKRVQSITFVRKGKQLTLEGIFQGGFTGDCTFTGVKVSNSVSQIKGPELEWENRSEEAYKYAEKARWN